ncbi:hypothetical protein CRU98_01870 [Arcobacter sp. CECT 8986]|uniref:gamma-glutamylcyclotransferase family protein n=1 Tax=Arcobacter sp. CECT 8986 TaxID=2044507 RepID=UPI001009E457|nr:gamma-glutamylcyclotransferase family protein [Arcobacter sp. CECT 8986]RXK01221.1 hypothetical protein CRU98_01870 [Arcobacter sp. CECT 8986]
MEKLFIYGTLAPGIPNEHKLSDIKGVWKEATVKGRLHQEGWGAQMGYPGIVLDETAQSVQGFLFSSDELYKKWELLDSFEGDEYQRTLTKVQLSDGTIEEAFIYELNQK